VRFAANMTGMSSVLMVIGSLEMRIAVFCGADDWFTAFPHDAEEIDRNIIEAEHCDIRCDKHVTERPWQKLLTEKNYAYILQQIRHEGMPELLRTKRRRQARASPLEDGQPSEVKSCIMCLQLAKCSCDCGAVCGASCAKSWLEIRGWSGATIQKWFRSFVHKRKLVNAALVIQRRFRGMCLTVSIGTVEQGAGHTLTSVPRQGSTVFETVQALDRNVRAVNDLAEPSADICLHPGSTFWSRETKRLS
jgi:hypothetical protein